MFIIYFVAFIYSYTHFELTGEEVLFLTAITTTSNTNAVPPAPTTSPITIPTTIATGKKSCTDCINSIDGVIIADGCTLRHCGTLLPKVSIVGMVVDGTACWIVGVVVDGTACWISDVVVDGTACWIVGVVIDEIIGCSMFWHCGTLLPSSSSHNHRQHVYCVSGSSPLRVAVYTLSSGCVFFCNGPLKETVLREELLHAIVNEVELELDWSVQDACTIVREIGLIFRF